MTALGRRNGTVFVDCAAVRRRAVARRLYTAAVDACDADNRNTDTTNITDQSVFVARYTEKVASRMLGGCKMFKFFGTDQRLK